MRAYRITTKIPNTQLTRQLSRTSSRTMSYCHPFAPVAFRRAVYPTSIQADFTPFLRMFDDLDTAFTRSAGVAPGHHRQHRRSFQPRFDVTEAKDAFHLHGELPGIEQNDINIEFVDQNTLVVSGKSVRERTSGNDSQAEASAAPAAVTESAETAAPAEQEKSADDFVEVESTTEGQATPTSTSNYHAPTIENEEGESSNSTIAAEPQKLEQATNELAQQNNEQAPEQQQQKPQNKTRYWVHERSSGEFQRSFTFHGQINQDGVTASLKNGVLNIVVPKAHAQLRKITLDA